MRAVLQQQPHTIHRGGAGMEIKNPKGNIVKTIRSGNSTIHICSDHFAKTPEEIEKVLDDYHAAGWNILRNAAEKEVEHG